MDEEAEVSIPTLPEDRVRQSAWLTTAQAQAFQSPPCPKTGCDTATSGRAISAVLFQSPPCPKTGCDSALCRWPWVQLLFQSPPCPKTGCDSSSRACSCLSTCFNPHPARRQGATSRRTTIPRDTHVSIPTLPEDRVRRIWRPAHSGDTSGFNPHPARRQGATGSGTAAAGRQAEFQSPPCPKTGCDSLTGANPRNS